MTNGRDMKKKGLKVEIGIKRRATDLEIFYF